MAVTSNYDIYDTLERMSRAMDFLNEKKRWLRNAANSKHSDGYNGKYDDDED